MADKYIEKSIYYFTKPGKPNTEDTLRFVKARADELDIDTICISTDTGYTVFKALEILPDKKLVAVSGQYGAGSRVGQSSMTQEAHQKLLKAGVKVVWGTQPLSNIDRAIRRMWGGITPVYLIAQILKLFGEGMKVVFEVAVMAADAGAIPMDREIIVVAGTIRGADTAVVMIPAHSNNFFGFLLKEIICMPRGRIPGRWWTDPDEHGREYEPRVGRSRFVGEKVDIEHGGIEDEAD
jgi:hypothetical protein